MAGSVAVLPDGLRLWVEPPDRRIASHVLANRYERNELDFIHRAVRPGAHVLDAGAHIGIYTVRMASLVGSRGSVTAIEPHPRHAECLALSLEANGLTERVRLVRAAATDASGERDLVAGGPGLESANAWLPPTGRAALRGETLVQVSTVRVDDLAFDRPLSFVRLDVEGAEGLALRGAAGVLASDRPVVLAELHPHLLALVSGMDAGECISLMAGIGYRCHMLAAGVPGPRIVDVPGNSVTSVIFVPIQFSRIPTRPPAAPCR